MRAPFLSLVASLVVFGFVWDAPPEQAFIALMAIGAVLVAALQIAVERRP